MTNKPHPLRQFVVFLVFVCTFFFTHINIAQAAESPTITWEGGREQSITMGGATSTKLWNLTIENSAGVSIPFLRSAPNAAGFVVYSVTLPDDLALGTYQVMMHGPNGEASIATTVEVVESTIYLPSHDPLGIAALALAGLALISFFALRDETTPTRGTNENNDDVITFNSSRFVRWIDFLRFNALHRLVNQSRFLTKIIASGSYIQALTGPLVVLMPVVGLVVGTRLGLTTDMTSTLVPTSVALIAVVIVIGILDALSGVVAISSYILFSLGRGHVQTVANIQTLVGLLLLACLPAIAASVTRSHKRHIANTAIAIGVAAWTVHTLVLSMNSLSQHKNEIVINAGLFAALAAGAMLIRCLGETAALRLTPQRSSFMTPRIEQSQSTEHFFIGLGAQAAVIALFMNAFFGFSWQIFAATTMLLLPSLIDRYSSNIPHSLLLSRLFSQRTLIVTVLFVVGVGISRWINAMPLLIHERMQLMALVLCIPTATVALLRCFSRPKSQIVTA